MGSQYETRGSQSIRYPTSEQELNPPGIFGGGLQKAGQEGPESYANPELQRQIEMGNGAAAEYAQSVMMEEAPVMDLPQPAPDKLGTPEYYDARVDDNIRRHLGSPPPPDYYLGYGQKYCRRFSEDLYPKLSAEGKKWCIATRTNLQLEIERELMANPAKFAALEEDSGRFKAFAFGTHPKAYLDGGLRELPVADLLFISATPDLDDLLSPDGLAQIGVVFPDVAGAKAEEFVMDAKMGMEREGTMEWAVGDREGQEQEQQP